MTGNTVMGLLGVVALAAVVANASPTPTATAPVVTAPVTAPAPVSGSSDATNTIFALVQCHQDRRQGCKIIYGFDRFFESQAACDEFRQMVQNKARDTYGAANDDFFCVKKDIPAWRPAK